MIKSKTVFSFKFKDVSQRGPSSCGMLPCFGACLNCCQRLHCWRLKYRLLYSRMHKELCHIHCYSPGLKPYTFTAIYISKRVKGWARNVVAALCMKKGFIYHIISYHIISHHITSHHITSHHILSYIISYHITSRYSISYDNISYIIISHVSQYSCRVIYHYML